MPAIFDKLNLKGQEEVVILDAPESFEPEIGALRDVRTVRELRAAKTVHFALAFVSRQTALDDVSSAVLARAAGDAVLWFAYPKKSSKRYACDFDRDHGWDVLLKAGWDTVRMVSIDADWSAVRFRRMEYIKRAPG
jgi:hypothetical protein